MQEAVGDWVVSRGLTLDNDADNKHERVLRFMEESLELAQACGIDPLDVLRIMVHVFRKPTGVVAQEVGGVMTTLFALGCAHDLDVMQCAGNEVERIYSLPPEKFQNRQRRNVLDGIGHGPNPSIAEAQ